MACSCLGCVDGRGCEAPNESLDPVSGSINTPVTTSTVASPGSGSALEGIQGITAFGDGNPNTVTTITYHFDTGLGVYGLTTNVWQQFEKDAYREALDAIEAIANINFVEVANVNNADFVEFTTSDSGFTYLGYHEGPSTAASFGNSYGIYDDPTWTSNNDAAGGFFFSVILHELMHGLGLGHPHDDGFGSTVMDGVNYPFNDYGDFNLNQGVYTVMSYNEGWHSENGNLLGSASWGNTLGLAALDIAALQAMYGANAATGAGATTYVMQTINSAGIGYQAIWDSGGVDEITYNGSGNATINLSAATLDYSATGGGVVSHVAGILGGFTIANGVVIENASGGSGNDGITGNSANNTLNGNDGHDVLNGRGGIDTLYGGEGDDVLIGGGGADAIHGGAGVDTLSFVGASGGMTLQFLTADSGNVYAGEPIGFDTFTGIENIWAGEQADTIGMSDGDNVVNGNGGNDVIFGWSGNDTLYGDADNDFLFGQFDDDTLYGGTGNDALYGFAGSDTLWGGAGADSFVRTVHGESTDYIMDYNYAEGDTIDVVENPADIIFMKSGADVVIYAPGMTEILFYVDNYNLSDGLAII